MVHLPGVLELACILRVELWRNVLPIVVRQDFTCRAPLDEIGQLGIVTASFGAVQGRFLLFSVKVLDICDVGSEAGYGIKMLLRTGGVGVVANHSIPADDWVLVLGVSLDFPYHIGRNAKPFCNILILPVGVPKVQIHMVVWLDGLAVSVNVLVMEG